MSVKIKPLSEQPKGGFKYKYKRLYDLGSDRMGVIDSMLTAGESTTTVVERIQIEWNQCASVKVGTLDKQLQRYRKDILEPKLAIAAEKATRNSIALPEAMKKFKEQVDVMDTLNEAINMQVVRVKQAYAKESRKGVEGKLDANISKELRALTDMCRVLAGLQLETGVVRRVPKQVQGFFQNLDTKELQEFRMEMSQSDETLKALGALTEVLEEAAGEIIDGEYTPIASEPTELSTEDGEALGPEAQRKDTDDTD